MLHYAILGSGSNGNSFILEHEGLAVVIDNGFSGREFLRRAVELKIDPEKIGVLLLTHTHGDHVSGVSILSRKLKIPVFCHEETFRGRIRQNNVHRLIRFSHSHEYRPLETGPVIFPFRTYHDCEPSSGYFLRFNGHSVCYLTDTGKIDDHMLDFVSRADLVFLESNYDSKMLENGPYPEFLKRRIDSEHGHLSNDAAAQVITRLLDRGRRQPSNIRMQIFLCHLSENNNSPAAVVNCLKERLNADVTDDARSRIPRLRVKNGGLEIDIKIVRRGAMFGSR